MPSYYVKSRKTGPAVEAIIVADTRENATDQAVSRGGEEDMIEVLEVREVPDGAVIPGAGGLAW